MSRDLSIPVHNQDLAILVESGMLTVETQRQLSTAVQAIPALKNATPPGKRHFSRIDSMLSVKSPSPVNRARDVLSDLDSLWSGASDEFHHFRQMMFDIKLRQAKLNIKRKRILKDEDEQVISDAECDLEQSQIDALKAKFSVGQAKLTDVIAKATQQSERYAFICKDAGVEQFSADDFLKEEAEYIIKTAWWHAGQTFRSVDARGGGERKKDKPLSEMTPAEQANYHAKIRRSMTMRVSQDVGVYFELLGISKAEVKTELGWIEGQRHLFNEQYQNHECSPPEFCDSGYFESWLQTTTTKYLDRVLTNMKQHGPERFKRLQSIITPSDKDQGEGTGAELKRGSLFEA